MKKIPDELKETIINALKFVVFTVVMTFGAWFIYAMIWFAVGLPQTDWALMSLFVLALGSVCLYIKWLY